MSKVAPRHDAPGAGGIIGTANDVTPLVLKAMAQADNPRLRTVAEGVETQAQMDFLKANQCDEIQGYLLSPPVPAEQFAELLR